MLAVAKEFLPRVRRNEPMSRHTSWHVGGPAEIYFTPNDRADLAAFLPTVPAAVPVYWVGLGSNLLVRDGGIAGVVVSMHGTFDRLERAGPDTVYAEAGVACARIARQCIKWGLGPAEFFAGIPGTLGGALAMNAGAFGGETWRHVVEVETIDRGGREHRRPASEYRVSYRHVEPPEPEEWFLGARLRFEARPPEHRSEVDALLERRKATQPIGEWSCGSVFTNPPGDHAARLIEATGLKGLRIGDASVSTKHANFIINHGAATAADVESLIARVQDEVQRAHGVRLHPEVRIVGRTADQTAGQPAGERL
jgi:UDP-N-acetylmuramate dehydrogenase